jgi:hypothetical protein
LVHHPILYYWHKLFPGITYTVHTARPLESSPGGGLHH